MATVRTSRRHLRSAVLVVAAATMVVACSGDGESPLPSVQPPAEEPAPEEPAPEPAPEEPAPEPAPEEPAPEPAPEEPPADEADGEPLTTEEWVFLILIGLFVFVVLGGLVAFLRRSPDQADDQGSTQRQLDDITQSCRSIHDSSIVAVLQVSDPIALQSTWSAARPQLVSLESRISYLASSLTDPGAQRTVSELGSAVAGVRGALDSNVALRLDADTPGQASLIEASHSTALSRSEQLELALQQALYLRL